MVGAQRAKQQFFGIPFLCVPAEGWRRRAVYDRPAGAVQFVAALGGLPGSPVVAAVSGP
ncbi:hypothetical protein SXCC_01731 [Gluconacetobacter sp. SXCC-1]|nr:hypothetical protein SXCC_01731 [Gluconacetobacter sp. SXCC-1]